MTIKTSFVDYIKTDESKYCFWNKINKEHNYFNLKLNVLGTNIINHMGERGGEFPQKRQTCMYTVAMVTE